jgi:DNA replication and repair protein RecF
MTEALDVQLSTKAALLYEKRAALCKQLAPEAGRYYATLSGHTEELSLYYRSDLAHSSLEALLKDSFQRDQAFGYTSQGIHRDEVVLLLNGQPVRKFGSQGQQKTFLVALKLAQFKVMKQRTGIAPILLLDDVFDKLDTNRVSHLLQLVAQEHFGQIFITDSNKARIEGIIDKFTNEYAFFDVDNGVITAKNRNRHET